MAISYVPVVNYRTWVAGDFVTSQSLNTERDNINFLTQRKPFASATLDPAQAAQPVADNSWTTMKMNTILMDNYGGFTTDGTYVVQVSGWYQVNAAVGFVTNGNFDRAVRLVINGFPGVSAIASCKSCSGIPTCVGFNRMVPLVRGNLVNVQGWHNAGANVDFEDGSSDVRGCLDFAFYSRFFGFGV